MNQKLITAFQKGENWAYGEIYKLFFNPIERYVRLKVGNDAVAQEITQEIFLKVFRFSSSYKIGLQFPTWLWTIAKNTVADFMRGSRSERSAITTTAISFDEIPSSEPSAENLMQQQALRKYLMEFARVLSPIQRRVLWLRLVAQLPYQEISNQVGLTVAAAKSLVHRARLQLCAELGAVR